MVADFLLTNLVELRSKLQEGKEDPKCTKLKSFIYKKYAKEIERVEDYTTAGFVYSMAVGTIAAPLIGYFCGLHNYARDQSVWANIFLACPGGIVGALVGVPIGMIMSAIGADNLDKRIEKEVLQNEELLKKITEE